MNENEQNLNQEKLPLKLIVLNVFLILAIISLFFLIYGKIKSSEAKSTEVENQVVSSPAFDKISKLSAKAAYVLDMEGNRVLFSKNETSQLPLASLTKLMTAVVAMDLVPKNSKVTIKNEFLQEFGDSGLIVNENWKLKDLLDFSLVASSNDGSRAIASVVGSTILQTEDYDLGRKDFIEKMNLKARELGLTKMYFINESGLDVSQSQGGGYGSAEEVATLLSYILKNEPEILEATKYPGGTFESSAAKHTISNTNSEVGYIPGLMASKTGYTDLAGGNLVVAFDAGIGRPVIVVVLGSTREERFSDVKTLVDATLEYFVTGQ